MILINFFIETHHSRHHCYSGISDMTFNRFCKDAPVPFGDRGTIRLLEFHTREVETIVMLLF